MALHGSSSGAAGSARLALLHHNWCRASYTDLQSLAIMRSHSGSPKDSRMHSSNKVRAQSKALSPSLAAMVLAPRVEAVFRRCLWDFQDVMLNGALTPSSKEVSLAKITNPI
eukprot:6491285-Amphidinium_carterae.7